MAGSLGRCQAVVGMAAPVSNGKAVGGGLVLASAALLAFLGTWEGEGQNVVYADKLAGGLPTVCKGVTRHITNTPIIVGDTWSNAKCADEEQRAVTKVQQALLRCFVGVPPQSVFDAATSHAWNMGVSATCGSGAMRSWNGGNWELGCRRLYQNDAGKPAWSYVKTGRRNADGTWEYKFVRGLANRRQAEYAMCKEDVR